MQIFKNKTAAITIALLFITSMGASTILMPTSSAHSPPWTIIDYAYISCNPSPIGVGQTMAICMWVDYPFSGTAIGNDIRRHDYTLTIAKPDGKIDTKTWPVVDDPTGVQYYQYTPDQVGNYTFTLNYPQQIYTWTGTWQNDTFLGASRSVVLTVQQEPLPAAITSYPLPAEYWTRPIEGQNTDWFAIASNWLAAPYIVGAPMGTHGPGGYQPYGIAPNSAHIMWTKPIQYGGVVGGNDTSIPGEAFYQGGSYNVRWSNPIIMYGTLYYQEPYGNGGTGGDYVAVDLRTGQEQWRINASATGTSIVPSFGYLYSLETPNQHGVLPNGLLIASTSVTGLGTVWRAYDPRTGVLTSMNISNVPSGSNLAGPSGEYLKYGLTNLGNSTNPKYFLSQWNSSDVFGGAAGTGAGGWYSGNYPANAPFNYSSLGTNTNWNGTNWVNSTVRTAQGYVAVSTPAYDWNISIPSLTGSSWVIGAANNGLIPFIDQGNMMLLTQGTFGCHVDMTATITASVTTDPVNVTAISLKPDTFGNVMWTKSYAQAPNNVTRTLVGWDTKMGVFITEDKETFAHNGFSLADGSQLWQSTYRTNSASDWNFFSLDSATVADGKLFFYGYSGTLTCYDISNGNILWTYGNGGEGNSTSSGFYTPYGVYPILMSAIADGKVYLDTTEHSPNSPLWKGGMIRCINATDGTELWKLFSFGNNMYGGNTPVADGFLTFLDTYNCQIYCVGKGPSSITVTAPDVAAPLGQPVVIRGTVTDIAAGTKQNEQAGRFPNGVPAVSDVSMNAWMEYVYQQKPKPANVIGVPVSLDVIDSNGNYRNIGTATSDASGTFGYTWTPDIPGQYTVVATFAGSNSYYPSSAETYFTATTAATSAPTNAPVTNLATTADLMTYLAVGVIAIIIAIAIVGTVIVMLFRKRP